MSWNTGWINRPTWCWTENSQCDPQYRLWSFNHSRWYPCLSRSQPHGIGIRGNCRNHRKKTGKRVIPQEFKRHAHHWLILHGRYICKARKPDCEHCILNKLCKTAFTRKEITEWVDITAKFKLETHSPDLNSASHKKFNNYRIEIATKSANVETLSFESAWKNSKAIIRNLETGKPLWNNQLNHITWHCFKNPLRNKTPVKPEWRLKRSL